MRVLVTGHDGYIGTVLVPILRQAGHEVLGLDNFMFEDCVFGDDATKIPALRMDVRDVSPEQLEGFDAILHLAGLADAQLHDLDPTLIHQINHHASVRLARVAKQADVSMFVFASSCSNYAAATDAPRDELSPSTPTTPYGVSKVRVEEDLTLLSGDSFSPVCLRIATGYGVSPRLRSDLVVNNLVGYAMTTGEIRLEGAGNSWRTLVHIEDISRAFLAVLQAPRREVHGQTFHVGITAENYRIRDVAQIVAEVVPQTIVRFGDEASPEACGYQVCCNKLQTALSEFQPRWRLRRGVEEIYAAYRAVDLTLDQHAGPSFQRTQNLRSKIDAGALSDELRFTGRPAATANSVIGAKTA